MGDINVLKSLIENSKSQLSELNSMQEQLAKYTASNLFVPDEFRDNIISRLNELAKLEVKIKIALSEFECADEIGGIDDAEKELDKIIEISSYTDILAKLKRVSFTDSRFNLIFAKLCNETASAINCKNYKLPAVEIAKAFLSDVCNHTDDKLNSVDGIIASPYGVLIIPIIQKTVYIDGEPTNPDKPTDNNNGNDDNGSGDSSPDNQSDTSPEASENAVPGAYNDNSAAPGQVVSLANSTSDKEESQEEESADSGGSFSFTESPFEITYCITEPPAKKKFSVTECLNLMASGRRSKSRMPDPECLMVVYTLNRFGAFTETMLDIYSEDFITYSGNNAKAPNKVDYKPLINKLIKSRVLRTVTTDDNYEPLYCLTENGKHLYENSTFRQLFLRKNFEAHLNSAVRFEINDYDVAASFILDKLLKDCRDMCDDFRFLASSVNFTGGRLFTYICNSIYEYATTVLMSITEDTVSTYLSYLSNTDEKDLNAIRVYIIASVDFRSCHFIYEQVKRRMGDKLAQAKFIGFSYCDDTYFDLNDDNTLTCDDIKVYVQGNKESSDTKESTTDFSDEDLGDDIDLDLDIDIDLPESLDYSDLNEEKYLQSIAAGSDVFAEKAIDDAAAAAEDFFEELNVRYEYAADAGADEIILTDNEIAVEQNEEAVVEENAEYSDNPVSNISFDEAKRTAQNMLISDSIYSALAYLKSLSASNSEIDYLYKLLAFACDDPMFNKYYNSDEILSMMAYMDLDNDFIQSLLLASTMRTVFYNDNKYDHGMKSLENALPDADISQIKSFIKECIAFKTANKNGYDAFCDYRVREQLKIKEEIVSTCKIAANYYDVYVIQPFRETVHMKRYKDTFDRIFNKNEGLVALCLNIVAKNNFDCIDMVKEFIEPYIKGDDIDENKLNDSAINGFIDEAWEECCEDSVIHHSTPLVSSLRTNLKNKVENCISVMAKWCRLSSNLNVTDSALDSGKKSKLIRLLNSIIASCSKNILLDNGKDRSAGLSCIIFTCRNLISRLDGTFNYSAYNKFFYINFLKSGDVMLVEDTRGNYLPDLRNYCYGINGFTIVDRIIKNFESCKDLKPEDPPIVNFDNVDYCDISAMKILLEFYESIGMQSEKYYADLKEICEYKEENLKGCTASFNNSHSEFIEYLELKKSYGAFDANSNDDIKEVLLRQAEYVYSYSSKSQNFGFYQRAIDCIRRQISIDSEIQRERIRSSLRELEESGDVFENKNDDETLKKAFDKLNQYIENDNFTAAEDLINRITSNDFYDIELDQLDKDLLDFQKCYDELYRVCHDGNYTINSSPKVKALIERYTRAMKDERSGKALCAAWITNSCSSQKMKTLLDLLGLNCKVRDNFNKNSYTHSDMYFDCTLEGEVNSEVRYSHVIAPFGSMAHTKSFRTVCLFGTYDDERLFAEIDKLTAFNKNTIIFVDYAFNEQFRRKLSDKIKRGRYKEIYMVVDRVMILYLATHYQKDSIIGKFINIAMPYSYYQPYVYDSMSKMPPEMFFGRTKELQDIEDRNGIHMLYGGRQLGKTALLKKARMDIEGREGERAVYLEIKDMSVKDAAENISYELVNAGLFTEDECYFEWKPLCRAIRQAIKKQKLSYFLLLLDEGDAFINDCANYDYRPIDDLKSIMDDDDINFKFVIAGLHDLVRFNRKAIARDSVIPHLRTLTIKPFTYSEAKKLLEIPLGELGLFFENDALISTILATTNYFPGLIQLYCANLVESLQTIDSSIYRISQVPPYYINEKHIQKILANKEFNDMIKNKFDITLELDKDNYYQIIALLLADMYHNGESDEYAVGYKAEDVYSRGVDYGIEKISNLELEIFTAYMDELVELNILRKHPDNSYTFLRQNFFQLMGSSTEILENLQRYIDME